MSVRERAAAALDDGWPQVLAALRRGLEDKDARKAAAVAVSYVQQVCGRQPQQPSDEATQADPLDVASMTREERDALSAKSKPSMSVECPEQTQSRHRLRAHRTRNRNSFNVRILGEIER
jgi:hypothetical protein